jgi:hypothetical protein
MSPVFVFPAVGAPVGGLPSNLGDERITRSSSRQIATPALK